MAKRDGTTPLLPEPEMRALGFTDHSPLHWYFCTRVGRDVTLNITIDKETGDYEELVMNEHFGQPEFYGRMVEPYRTAIRDAVDAVLSRLNTAGLNVAVDHRAYAFETTESETP